MNRELENEYDRLVCELEDLDVDAPGAATRFAELAIQVADLDQRIKQDRADTSRRFHESIRSGNYITESDVYAGQPRPYANDPDRRPQRSALAAVGRAAPLGFDEQSLRAMHQAALSHSSYAITAPAVRDTPNSFSTVSDELVAQLSPVIVGPSYESRLLARLPVLQISAPSYEFIRHNSTTGTPAVTPEGTKKPELVLDIDNVVVTATKLAAHAAASWESVQDFSSFTSYLTGELTRQLIDVENGFLLSGDGAVKGMLNTVGVLPHVITLETPLDALEMAISELRVGPALAEANLCVMHPATWSAVRRSKDLQDRYMTAPDPTAGEASSVWGVEVLATTAISEGIALLLDTRKFGRVVVREAISLRQGFDGDDFTRNLIRWVAETRLALCVERPSAICVVEGFTGS